MRVVLDTDVLIAGMRSPTGASRQITRLIGSTQLEAVATVPMILEYEAVLKRQEHLTAAGLTMEQVDTLIDVFAALLVPVAVQFFWRPLLRDPNDEMVLEAAVNGYATAILTFNTRHFERAAQRFGIEVLRPGDLLRRLNP